MIRAAIVGFGNIGKAVREALSQSPDVTLACIVSSQRGIDAAPVVADIAALRDIDVAILCGPSRAVPEMAEKLLSRGIRTVDSFDIHTSILDVRNRLDAVAKAHQCAAVTAAGWDPGSDSVIRALAEAMLPKGLTYTNFGPGMSMGHTVAVKGMQGVQDALSMTIPLGTGLHRRMVYVELAPGAELAAVTRAIKADDYFAHDETHVIEVESVDALKDMGHGVNLERKGVSGTTHNQRLSFTMSIQNPALTAQILVASARAVMRQAPGCYTMIEIPPIHFLPGEADAIIRRLV